MAVEEKDTGKEEKKPKSKTLLFIIIAVVVLVLAGVGAFFAMSKSGGNVGDDEDAEEEADDSDVGEIPGAIMPLETFIVNLQVKGSFLKCTVNLQFDSPELPPNASAEMPRVRDAVIRVLSRKSHQDILSPEGKEKLKEEIRMSVNQTLNTEGVVGVYFTEFIVQ